MFIVFAVIGNRGYKIEYAKILVNVLYTYSCNMSVE